MFFLNIGMTFTAKVADRASSHGAGKQIFGSRHQQKLSIAVYVRVVFVSFLAVKLVPFNRRITPVASVTGDIVLKMNALFPFLYNTAEFTR